MLLGTKAAVPMASASKLAACESPFDTIVYLLFRYMKEYDDVYSLLTSLIKSESNVVCFS